MYKFVSLQQSIPASAARLLTTSQRAPAAFSSTSHRTYSEHSHDTLHVPQKNKERQVSNVPPIMQGIQPMSREMSPNDTKEVLVQAQAFLKNQQDRSTLLKNKMQNVNQGAACREIHTIARSNIPTASQGQVGCMKYTSFGQLQLNMDEHETTSGTVTSYRRQRDSRKAHTDATICGTADTWDEDMACVLQGSCLPGSTKYCRTKSMFGSVELPDVLQGTFNSGLTGKMGIIAYHTVSSPNFTAVRYLHNRPSHFVGRTYEAWDEDVATFIHGNKNQVHEFNEIPKIDRATRLHYHTDPRSQFVPPKDSKARFGEVKRALHTGDTTSSLSERLGRNFETWDEDVAHMLHNLPSKPVFGRPRKDIRPASAPPAKYVPVSSGMSFSVRHCYTESSTPQPKTSQRERLKQAVRDYGATVVVFHVGISLMSLGGFYLAVSSGIDMQVILNKVGMGQAIADSKVAAGASTFVVAYAVHKMFAPARIAITLTSTPFIVRYLRRVGVLKQPVSK